MTLDGLQSQASNLFPPDHTPGSPEQMISQFSIPQALPLLPLENPIPRNAWILLSHYKDHVVRLLSPRQYYKSPWQILHLPSALTTLAQLTIGETVNHARSALFYALLTISAFSVEGLRCGSGGNYWKSIGEDFRRRSQRHLKCSLQYEVMGSQKAKYKEILMAMLAMVTVSVRKFVTVLIRSHQAETSMTLGFWWPVGTLSILSLRR